MMTNFAQYALCAVFTGCSLYLIPRIISQGWYDGKFYSFRRAVINTPITIEERSDEKESKV
jgi:hypothetical protein